MRAPDIHIEHIAQFQSWLEGGMLSEKAAHKLRCILHYLQNDTTAAQTAALFGTTPNALRRWLQAFDPANPASLEEKSRRPLTLRSSQLSPTAVALIYAYRRTSPKTGKEEIAVALLRDHGIRASASAVGRVIERDCLYFGDSPLHRRKRLHAQHAMPAVQTTVVPVPSQVLSVPVATGNHRRKFVYGAVAASLLFAFAISYGTNIKIEQATENLRATLFQSYERHEP